MGNVSMWRVILAGWGIVLVLGKEFLLLAVSWRMTSLACSL